MNNKNNFSSCYIDIHSGSGGLESEDWSKIIARMYIKWAKNNFYNISILNQSIGLNNGIKSISIKLKGKYVYEKLKLENGIHRLVRINPLKKSNKKQTSFSSVSVYPSINENHYNINLNLKSKDIKIEVFKSSGPGGQHVNSTNTAARLIHIPTGIITKCQNERSLYQNKKLALEQLKSKLLFFNKKYYLNIKKEINKNKLSIQWSNHIRSYMLDDNFIKDLRTGKIFYKVKDILNGNLEYLF